MRRYGALFRPPGAFCAGQSWADCITNTAGSDFRQGQLFILPLFGAQLGIDLNLVWHLVSRLTSVIIDAILWLTGNT